MEAASNGGESPIDKASAWVDRTRSQLTARLDSTRSQVTARVGSTRSQVTGRVDSTRSQVSALTGTVTEPQAFEQRPELFVGAAFAGGLLLAGLIRLVGR